MSTFVTVGNAHNPFPRLLRAVESVVAVLPQPVFVQCGHTVFSSPHMQLTPFVGHDEFLQKIADCDLLICHAGVGTLIHAAQAGKMPVVMPRLARFGEHIDNHQVEFAAAMALERKIALAMGEDEMGEAIALARSTKVDTRQPRAIALVDSLLRKLTIASKNQ